MTFGQFLGEVVDILTDKERPICQTHKNIQPNQDSYEESVEMKALRVGQYLAQKRFTLCDSIGKACNYGGGSCIGFLKDDPNRPPERNYEVNVFTLFGLQRVYRRRRDFIGKLWLSNWARGANVDSNWCFEVYGRENLPQFQTLAEELSREFKVSIRIVLESEYSQRERFFDDGGM